VHQHRDAREKSEHVTFVQPDAPDEVVYHQVDTDSKRKLQTEQEEEEEEIYICSSRLGLIKMDHRHSGNG
jgi:hypothetical protein